MREVCEGTLALTNDARAQNGPGKLARGCIKRLLIVLPITYMLTLNQSVSIWCHDVRLVEIETHRNDEIGEPGTLIARCPFHGGFNEKEAFLYPTCFMGGIVLLSVLRKVTTKVGKTLQRKLALFGRLPFRDGRLAS